MTSEEKTLEAHNLTTKTAFARRESYPTLVMPLFTSFSTGKKRIRQFKLHTQKHISSAFIPALKENTAIQIYFGGAGSGKSVTIAKRTILDMLAGKRNFLIVRKVYGTLKDSFYTELKKAAGALGVSKYFKFTKSPLEITCKINGAKAVFRGMDDPEKVKSITVDNGVITDVVIEEATELTAFDFELLETRLRGACEVDKRITILFNPIHTNHWLYTKFFLGKFPDDACVVRYDVKYKYTNHTEYGAEEVEGTRSVLIHKSTHWQNEYLTPEDHSRYESLKITSPYMYRVYTLGHWGVLGEKVYDHIEYVDEFPEEVWNLPWRIGNDHGFNDYETLVLSKYDERKGIIYWVDQIAHRKMMPKDFAQRAKMLLDKYNVPHNHPIRSDNNETRMNEVLKQEGLNIERTIKGAGSKFAGLMWMKSRRMFALKSNRQFKESADVYVWKKDKNGNPMDDTEHHGSDILDGGRYGYEKDIRGCKGVAFGKSMYL